MAIRVDVVNVRGKSANRGRMRWIFSIHVDSYGKEHSHVCDGAFVISRMVNEKQSEQFLEAMEMCILKRMLRVSWTEKQSNVEILNTAVQGNL